MQGKREAILELLEDLGEVPGELVETIGKEKVMLRLKALHKAASKSVSIAEFMEKFETIYNTENE